MASADSPRIDGRTLRHAGRRDELLSAAMAYVSEHGLSDLSIRPIAEAMGITHRTLLHHFGSKEQLIVEILLALRERDRDIIAAEAERLQPEDAGELIRSSWKRMSSPRTRRYWASVFEIYGIAVKDPDRYGSYLVGFVEDWLTMIEDALVRLGADPERAAALASLILASFRGLCIDLLATGDVRRLNRAVDELANTVQKMVDAQAVVPPGA